MDPLATSFSALHAAYQLILFSVDIDQVPSQVRRSLELVQTCHRDLQHLIEIRNECLSILEQTPIVLRRVNEIIAAANQGLVEVCRIVEKCRPGANNGRVPLKNRLEWVLFDSKEFKAQEPVISRHHASVLSELNFLRQTALLAPQFQEQKSKLNGQVRKQTEIFDNVTLLGGLMGGMAISGTTSHHSASFPTEVANPASPDPQHSKSIDRYPPYPPPYSQYPVQSSAVSHTSFGQIQGPFEPSFQTSIPPSQPAFRPPKPDNMLGSCDVDAGLPTQAPELTRPIQFYQPYHPFLQTSSVSYTPGSSGLTNTSESDPQRPRILSPPSTPWLRSSSERPNALLPQQLSNPSIPTKPPQKETYSGVSGYFSLTQRAGNTVLNNRGSTSDLSYDKSQGGGALIPQPQDRPFITRASNDLSESPFSPSSIHAWSNRNHPATAIDSEAPILTTPDSISIMSCGTLSGLSPIHSGNSFGSFRTGDRATTYTKSGPGIRPSSLSIEPSDSRVWTTEDGSTALRSLASRSQSDSSHPALIFGSAFWGHNAGRDFKELGNHTVGLVPDHTGHNPTKYGNPHADLKYHKDTVTIVSRELQSPYPPYDVAELP